MKNMKVAHLLDMGSKNYEDCFQYGSRVVTIEVRNRRQVIGHSDAWDFLLISFSAEQLSQKIEVVCIWHSVANLQIDHYSKYNRLI